MILGDLKKEQNGLEEVEEVDLGSIYMFLKEVAWLYPGF